MTNLFKTLAVGAALTIAATANAELATLSVDVSNVTSRDASFVITCDNPDVPFYYQIVPAVKLEPFGGTSGIYDFQKAQWEDYAKMYDASWLDFIDSSMRYYGSAEDNAAEWLNIIGGVDYVVFALGMGPDGNLTTNTAYKEFTAVAPIPSYNTFEFSMISIEDLTSSTMKATAKITPSNNDTYSVQAYPKDFVDKYDLTPGSAGLIDFIGNMMWDIDASSLVSGEQVMTFNYLLSDMDYYLVAVGFDENLTPTTAPTLYAFTCKKNRTGRTEKHHRTDHYKRIQYGCTPRS